MGKLVTTSEVGLFITQIGWKAILTLGTSLDLYPDWRDTVSVETLYWINLSIVPLMDISLQESLSAFEVS